MPLCVWNCVWNRAWKRTRDIFRILRQWYDIYLSVSRFGTYNRDMCMAIMVERVEQTPSWRKAHGPDSFGIHVH